MLKDLNLLKKYIKNEEASYNFKLVFALSKRPHFNSVYLVRVPFLTGIAVHCRCMFGVIQKLSLQQGGVGVMKFIIKSY